MKALVFFGLLVRANNPSHLSGGWGEKYPGRSGPTQAGLGMKNVNALSEGRIHEESVPERGALTRIW
jgi:hypothetical protein